MPGARTSPEHTRPVADVPAVDLLYIDALKEPGFLVQVIGNLHAAGVTANWIILDDALANSAMQGFWQAIEARLYPSKLPVTAVHLMNADVLPTFEEHGGKVETVLSDNGREFCGRPDQHPYELFLQLEDIAHRTCRVKRPQSNGIVERFHRTVLDEHFRVEGRRTWFETIEEMQIALNAWLVTYNTARPHQGRGMNGRTPIRAFTDGLPKPDTKRRAADKTNQTCFTANPRRLIVGHRAAMSFRGRHIRRT